MLSHMDPSEWEYECDKCGRRLASEYRLNVHKRVHTKEKKFVCKFCGNKYGSTKSLGVHLRKDHRDEKEVQADIAIRRIKVKETSLASKSVEKDELEVREECSLDLEEMVQVNEEMVVLGDDNEVEQVNNVVGEDEDFVNLEDIY